MNLDTKEHDNFQSEKIYLNNASVSLLPQVSIQAMIEFLLSYNKLGPDSIDSESFVLEQFRRTRKIISQIINCQPDEVILTQSTTDGVNIVANGLSFNLDSNIIIRGKTHEHHANYYPWLNLSKKLEIRNLQTDKNGFFEISEIEKLIDKKTQLVALSHALYNTGFILPVEIIGEILEQNNIAYFLDTAQTIGCIGDFDVQKTKCDFMAFNGSKWLCGPMGTGLLYCKRSSSDLLEPMEIGGESAIIYDEEKLAYKESPDKFQTGFRNYVGLAGLETSANYLLKIGMNNIRQKNIKLANLLRDELSKIQEITLYGPEDADERTSIISFNIKGQEPDYVVKKLEKQNIVLAVREILNLKLVRASPHFFNSAEEIMKVIDAIKNL